MALFSQPLDSSHMLREFNTLAPSWHIYPPHTCTREDIYAVSIQRPHPCGLGRLNETPALKPLQHSAGQYTKQSMALRRYTSTFCSGYTDSCGFRSLPRSDLAYARVVYQSVKKKRPARFVLLTKRGNRSELM